jgi:RimJ/RimL family protein N-acetyltransferase/methionyl-tRNA formyltransferase
MLIDEPLKTSRLVLRPLCRDDVCDRYVGWLNDPNINRFLEVRFHRHCLESTRAYVEQVNGSPDTLLLGMFVGAGRDHIGNIKIGPINHFHKRADIGLLIGEPGEWGKGYASEAIEAVSRFAHEKLGLRKITAGCYSDNVGSMKAFLKVGYTEEARLADHWETDSGLQDEILLALNFPSTTPVITTSDRIVTFGPIRNLVLIGGGDLLLDTVQCASNLGFRVTVIMAPRHANEVLPLSRKNAESECRRVADEVIVTEDINALPNLAAQSWTGEQCLALCFGPAWIFSQAVISSFGAGMLNFNGIPVPRYLGGAHYTWQILNGSRQGGCFIQQITPDVDRGDILRAERFELPRPLTTPQDYFNANHQVGKAFLQRFLSDVKNLAVFPCTPFADIDAERLYFPRLLTKSNAYIDWRWTGGDIARFCCAFDEPYMGAATSLGAKEVRMKRVRFIAQGESFHPYASGLVVRRIGSQIWVAVRGGLLHIGQLLDDSGRDMLKEVREGMRFATSPEQVHRAQTERVRIPPN